MSSPTHAGIEDFGIVPVEAQACGAPVVAVDAGGARDSVVPGLSGQLVPLTGDAGDAAGSGDEVENWAQQLAGFDARAFDPVAIRRHAESFSRAHFRAAMDSVVAKAAS